LPRLGKGTIYHDGKTLDMPRSCFACFAQCRSFRDETFA